MKITKIGCQRNPSLAKWEGLPCGPLPVRRTSLPLCFTLYVPSSYLITANTWTPLHPPFTSTSMSSTHCSSSTEYPDGPVDVITDVAHLSDAEKTSRLNTYIRWYQRGGRITTAAGKTLLFNLQSDGNVKASRLRWKVDGQVRSLSCHASSIGLSAYSLFSYDLHDRSALPKSHVNYARRLIHFDRSAHRLLFVWYEPNLARPEKMGPHHVLIVTVWQTLLRVEHRVAQHFKKVEIPPKRLGRLKRIRLLMI